MDHETQMSEIPHLRTREQFLTDDAAYFRDKKSTYLQIKDDIAAELGIPLSIIRLCGSAYWGYSFTEERPFDPSISDLDIAIIDPTIFIKCLSEVRQMTWNFSNLTSFRGGLNNPIIFQDYAYKKGIIRLDLMPYTKFKKFIEAASGRIYSKHAKHFVKLSFMIYDSENSFTVKQIISMSKFKGEKIDKIPS